MRIFERKAKWAVVISIQGSFEPKGMGCAQFMKSVLGILSEGHTSLVVDLRNCIYVSPAGWQAISAAYWQFVAAGGTLKVIESTDARVMRLAARHGLDQSVEVHDSLEKARKSS